MRGMLSLLTVGGLLIAGQAMAAYGTTPIACTTDPSSGLNGTDTDIFLDGTIAVGVDWECRATGAEGYEMRTWCRSGDDFWDATTTIVIDGGNATYTTKDIESGTGFTSELRRCD